MSTSVNLNELSIGGSNNADDDWEKYDWNKLIINKDLQTISIIKDGQKIRVVSFNDPNLTIEIP